MKVAVLDYKNVVMSSVAGPYDMFSQINGLMENFCPSLKIEKVQVEIIKSEDLNNEMKYDLVIIPAMDFLKIMEVLENEKKMIEWIKLQYEKGSEVASICLGAFLLASAGLLNEKKATTHWLGADLFRNMFPEVNVVDDKIITDYDRIYTSGGAYSFTTLMIYLIEKHFGHETAVITSKVFMVHIHDTAQTSFNIFNLQKTHNNNSIEKIQQYIEKNFSKGIRIEELADLANMTVRTFIRNFKKATGNTPYEYIQKVKIERAKKLLELMDVGIEQVSFEVGYSDFAAFRKIFKKYVGLTPSKYKKTYGKMFYPEFVYAK